MMMFGALKVSAGMGTPVLCKNEEARAKSAGFDSRAPGRPTPVRDTCKVSKPRDPLYFVTRALDRLPNGKPASNA